MKYKLALMGVAPVKIIPAGRLASRPSAPVATLSETANVPTVTQMRMTTPAITTQRIDTRVTVLIATQSSYRLVPNGEV